MLNGIDHFPVLLLRQNQTAQGSRRLRVRDDKTRRGSKWQAFDAIQLTLHEAAARHFQQHIMKLGVQRHILREGFIAPFLRIQHTVNGIQAARGASQQCLLHAALRSHARRQTFQRSTQLNGVRDIGLGKHAHLVAATTRRCLQHAFLLQAHQRRTNRCARDAQTLSQHQLGNTLTSSHLARKNHLAQLQLRLDDLGVVFFCGWSRCNAS